MGTKVSDYAIGDSNIESVMLTLDKAYKGKYSLTLSELDTDTVPEIEAGSWIDNNGALYKFDSNEAISITDPVTSVDVVDGTVYICLIPEAGTASGATTDSAGYSIGATVITLASAGTGTILAGDKVQFAGDTAKYTVVSGDADVSNGGTITIEAITQAIPASATAITLHGASISAAFTATPPTFSSSKQGWYGTGGQANYRYLYYIMTKSSTAYTEKYGTNDEIFRKTIIKMEKTSNQDVGTTLVSVTFGYTGYDAKAEYNTSSNYFQPADPGFYKITFNCGSASFGGLNTFHAGLSLNSLPASTTASNIIMQGVGEDQTINVSTTMYLKTTDSIYAWGKAVSGTTRIYGRTSGSFMRNGTTFEVERIA